MHVSHLWWPYPPKHQAISYEPKVSRVILRISAIPTNELVFPAYWSTSLQCRCLLKVPRALITIGMTDTLLQFQILIRTSTFTFLKWSIFSVSFSATRVSKGQATSTMKHTLPSFSRTTILLLLLLESKTGQMKTPNGSTQHEAGSPGFMWWTNANLNFWVLHKEHWLLGRIKSLYAGQKCVVRQPNLKAQNDYDDDTTLCDNYLGTSWY